MAWLTYAPNARYDPKTGAVQYNRSGDWQDIGNIKTDATGRVVRTKSGADSDEEIKGPASWDWAMPSADQVRQMGWAAQGGGSQEQQQAAVDQASGGPLSRGNAGQAGSYYSSNFGPGVTGQGGAQRGQASMAAQPNWTKAFWSPDQWRQFSSGDADTQNQMAQAAGLSRNDLTSAQGAANPRAATSIAQPEWTKGIWNADQWAQFATGDASTQAAMAQQAGLSQSDLSTAQGWVQPEAVAQRQMAAIDPTSEAARTALGQSYLQNLQQGGVPKASDVQSYLNVYRQIDPTGYAGRAALAGQMGSYLQGAQREAALGSQLDAGTIREVEQATRRAQQGRGNVYGTPQLVQEAMERGSAGEARRQQRQQALGQALQQSQGYYTSGADIGSVANALYQQGYGRQQAAQQNALSYLSSGQTPYQAGQSYLNAAENRAAGAAQGGPQYNPQALGQGMGGTAQQFPQYGLGIGQQTQGWYNSLNAYAGGGGGSSRNPTMGALGGAASGALSGAAAGTAVYPGIGTLVGAGLGAIGGGISGYSR